MKLLVFLLALFFIPSHSLIIYIGSTKVSLPSFYSTIGIPPASPLRAGWTFLSRLNLTDDCHFHPSTNLSSLNNSVLILTDTLPSWHKCTYDVYGSVTAFARIAQVVGSVAIVAPATEKYSHGRVVAFESSIYIPYVVTEQEVIDCLVQNNTLITALELSAVSEIDAHYVKSAKNTYFAWRIICSVMYGVLLFLLGYVMFEDVRLACNKRKMYWHSVVMKIIALLFSLLSFLWVIVDPFGFFGFPWQSAFVFSVSIGLFMNIFMLLLHIWIIATGNRTSAAAKSKVFSHTIHALSAVMIVLSVVQGALWYIPVLTNAFWIAAILVMCLCGIGFVIFGRNIVLVLNKSKNQALEQSKLSYKILSFVVFFVIVTYTTAFVWGLELLGAVYSLMLAHFAAGFLTLVTFLVLFCPALWKRKQRKLTTNSTSTSPNTTQHTTVTPENSSILIESLERPGV